MDLKIPNIVKPIALKDFTEGKGFPPEFDNAVIWVWVNPRRELRQTFVSVILKGDATDEQIGSWFSEMWSQGPDDTHFTAEEVVTLATACAEYEPGLWNWLVKQTNDLVIEHLSAKKKTSTTPPSS